MIRSDQIVLLNLGPQEEGGDVVPGGDGDEGSDASVEYAGRAGTLAALLRLFKALGGHEGMRRLFFKHEGVDYFWDEIAYTSASQRYEELIKKRAGLLNLQGHWPWIVAGTVGKSGAVASKGRRLEVNIYPKDEFGRPPVHRVSGYSPNTPEFQVLLASLRPGTEVIMLLGGITVATGYRGVLGSLSLPNDLVRASDIFFTE